MAELQTLRKGAAMSAFVDQLPALIGVVVGATASYLAGAHTERARWKHELSSRWDESRKQAYATYGYALKNVYVQCLRIAANCRGLGVQRETLNEKRELEKLGQLTDERTAIWESVRLLGARKTVEAGHAWHELTGQIELFARKERSGPEEWKALLAQWNSCRDRFYMAAREDLGIQGDLPPSTPWGDQAAAVLSSGVDGGAVDSEIDV